MNIYEIFPDFDDFNTKDQELLLRNSDSIVPFEKYGTDIQRNDPFKDIRTNKTFEEISNEIAKESPFKENSFFHSNFKNQQQSERYSRDIFTLMDKNCITEIYYTHNPKGNNNVGLLVYFNNKSKVINLINSKISIEKEVLFYELLKEKCEMKVSVVSGGNFVIKGKDSDTWKVVHSNYYTSFPNNLDYYKGKFSSGDLNPSHEELKQVYEDLLSRKTTVMLCKNHVDFDVLAKKVQKQLSEKFYNNVNTSVYIRQIDSNGKVLKENLVRTNYQKPWEIKLNITLKPNGEIVIKHVASENYLKNYVDKWQKEAKARGLDVSVEDLRKQVINDFESQATEKSFYQKFIQKSKALLDERIVGYVEGIQVTSKIGKNVWEEGVINQSTWLTKDKEYTNWPKYAQINPLVGGVTDGAIDEIVGIPLAVKGVYEIVTDEEKQKALQKIFTKDGAKQMLEGIAASTKETLKDGDKTQHFAGQTVVSVASMISGAGFFNKAGKIDDVAELGADLSKAIPDAKATSLLDDVRKAERRIDNDKIFKELKNQIDEDLLEDFVKDGTEEIIAKGKKLSFKELQTFWKRGNDFNNKSKKLEWYKFNELWVEHPTKIYPKGHKQAGKPRRFRVDSYDISGNGKIVSRKATDLSEIKFSTFQRYCSEIKEKYPVGAKIARKEDGLGNTLKGEFYLEIPESNKSFEKINEYIKFAKELNPPVTIIFKPE